MNKTTGSYRVLIMEDDDATRQAAVFKLEKEGFEVEEANNGIQALDMMIKDGTLDLILMDIRMPRGDGFHFLEEKQKDARVQNVPVIVFTNLSQPEFVDRALKLGAKGYLVKAHHSLSEIIIEVKNCIAGGVCRVDR